MQKRVISVSVNELDVTVTSKELVDFWNKLQSLKGGESLWTAFGTENQYFVEKTEDGFLFSMHGIYWNSPKIYYHNEIKTIEDVITILSERPDMYALNQIIRKVIHWDNWRNFLNSFKVIDANMVNDYKRNGK